MEPLVVLAEHLDVGAFAELLSGHDVVVWSAGAGGGNPDRTYAVDRDAAITSMDAARRAGVRRYVMVSYFGAGPGHGVPADNGFFAYAQAKAAADAHLRATDLDWTILGPGPLTNDPATGSIDVGAAAAGGSVSRADVAAVLAAVLDNPASVHRTIEFNNGRTPIAEAVSDLGNP